MTADAIENLTLAEVEERVKAILDGEADDADLPALVERLVLPTNGYGVPLDGEDYLLRDVADYLAPDKPNPSESHATNLKRMRMRQKNRDRKRRSHEIAPSEALMDATAITRDATSGRVSDSIGPLAGYLLAATRLIAPTNAPSGFGALPICSPAHARNMDIEAWAARQADATKDFLYELTLEATQGDLADMLNVTRPTVVAWQDDLYRAIEDGSHYTPARKRRRRTN